MSLYDVVGRICTLTHKGSVVDYTDEFEEICYLLPPDSIDETVLVGYFIRGLRPNYRRDIRISEPKTVSDAARLATLIEDCEEPRFTSKFFDDDEDEDDYDTDFSSSPQSYPTDTNGDIIVSSHASNQYNDKGSTRGVRNSSNQPHKYTNRKDNYSGDTDNSASDKRKEEIIRRICRDNDLCFKCFQAGHKSYTCQQVSYY